MKVIKYSLLIISIFFISGKLIAQDAVKELDKVYGLDQTLYNGKKYSFIVPPGTSGHQFLQAQLFSDGTLTLKGKEYHDIALNYDIYNQQLLLQYADDNFPVNFIEVSKAWLQSFSLGDMKFRLLQLEKEPQFYQVIGDGPLQILYFWRKTLNLNDVIGTSNFVFSVPLRDSFVLMNRQLKPFKTRRSLIQLFDRGQRQEIKNYMRKNKIKVKKSSDHAMADLINFIGKLK